MTEYEILILIIGIATLLVALATFVYVFVEKRINVKVDLILTHSTPPIIGSSPPVLYTKEPSNLILQAHLYNEGVNPIYYRSFDLYLDNQIVILQPEISPIIYAEKVESHQHVSFTYAFVNKLNNIPKLIECKGNISLRFGITLQDSKERMSKPIYVVVKEK